MNQLRQSIPEILGQALELPEAERSAYLAAACEDDERTRLRVERLLAAVPKAAQLLEPPSADCLPTIDRGIGHTIGSHIGPYKLLEQIGEGGMGLVYMAEQQRPVKRLVALKLIKPGMDSKQVIARFEAERQALAMMDHLNIAKVLDAGTTETGRPYFAMELVRGIPLNDFCDQKRFTVRERLELFNQICLAVQHAHQKGIIHRDLKPTNVLITLADSRPVPKVIDFGIAKALGQSLTDHTLHTGYAQLVGTPLYMSPEQAEMNLFGVDTRSDVYSLGVMLYELLTGMTPFDKESLTKAGLDEMRRIIREQDPPRPSARLSTLKAEALSTISQHRSIDPRRISLALRGELDWIVMKALEKDRSDRYESASALASDIERFLNDEPVQACPPTAVYRFRKFARKHRAVLSTGLVVAASLLVGIVLSSWQAVRATTAEAQANFQRNEATQQRNEAREQRDEAERQRDEIKALKDRLQQTLYTAHINLAHNAWKTDGAERMRELLDQHRPQPGETDLRGFEWFYLHRLCHQEVHTLQGHIDAVKSVTYSPDGKLLASSARNGAVRIWDTQYGRELLRFKAMDEQSPTDHPKFSAPETITFSPDGKRLAGAFGNAMVKVWDAQTGKVLLKINPGTRHGSGHPMDSKRLAYSPDGNRFVCGTADGPIKVWDANTGEELLSFIGHTDSVSGVALSSDGKRLASVSDDGTVKVWDAHSGEELCSLDIYDAIGVAFSPDGKRLASAGMFKTITVWNALTGERLLTIMGGGSQATFSPDGKRLVCTSGNSVKVWHAQTGEELFSVGGHTEIINGLALRADGKQLATASSDKTVKLWDIQFIPKPLALHGAPALLRVMAFSPDGRRVAASLEDTVRVWDVPTGRQLHVFAGHKAEVRGLAFSPDGKFLAIAAGQDSEPPEFGEVIVRDVQSGNELLNVQGGGFCAAFSRDGQRLASGSREGKVQVWEVNSGEEQLNFKAHGRLVRHVAFSPDGQRLAISAWTYGIAADDGVKVWDAQTGQQLWRYTNVGKLNGIDSVVYSPDGQRLASTFTDKTVKVLDSQTGQLLVTLNGHTMAVTSVVFSPDGKRLATTSSDDTVKVWDAHTGHELLTFKGSALSVSFSPDGHRLLGGSPSGTLTIYDATPLPEKP